MLFQKHLVLIDTKDLKLDCRKDHTCNKCQSCGEVSVNSPNCPKCQSSKLEQKSVTCKNCIDIAKQEIKKLTGLLVDDFGIEQKNIQVYFSGNEGFHVYVYDSQYQKLGSRERSELADYLMFRGAIPETFGFNRYKPDRSSFSDLNEEGWRGRLSKHIFGSKSKRSKIISQILANGYSSFQNQLDEAKNEIGVVIDPNVTMDIHRIFRLPGSLNSKSGLVKQKCDNIEEFNPFTDACFIDDSTTEVLANCPLVFKLKNKKFGPYNKEKITVPKFAAVYMICKGLATSA